MEVQGGRGMLKLGFIGNGNMGYAILKGIISQKELKPEEIGVYDKNDLAKNRAKELGCKIFQNEEELVRASESIILAIKPQAVKTLLFDLGEAFSNRLLISILPVFSKEELKAKLGREDVRILRVMPNTPAMIGEGVSALDEESDASREEKAQVERWFQALGKTYWVSESMFPLVIGFTGGGPAYVAMFIEALADAGVKGGLRKAEAVELAAQTVLGSAKLILEEGYHPSVARDQVCSPGGTTICGVHALEEGRFRYTVMQAVEAAKNRALKM